MKERIIYSPSYVKDKNLYNFLNLFSLDFKPKMKEREFLFFIQSVWEFLKINNDVSFCIESSIHCVKKKFHGDIENIISMLNKGHLLSYALEKVGIFPEYAINILKAGENNKNFKETFLMLKNFIEWNIEQKKKLKSALTYPIFTLLVFIGVTFLFSNYIAPAIFDLLTSLNADNVKKFKIFSLFIGLLKTAILLGCAFIASLSLIFYSKRELFEKILLYIPMFGNFFKYKSIYMVSYYISTSLNKDVSILNSFDIAIKSCAGMAKEVLLTIKKDIIKGIKINQSILQFNFIPDTVSKIIKTGEDSGSLENSFSLVQQIFYSKYQAIMQNLIHVLPIIIIMMTSIMMICFIFLLFMPLYSVGI